MDESYGLAFREITSALNNGGHCLDCGANTGGSFDRINKSIRIEKIRYHGIEWHHEAVQKARAEGLNVVQCDLNRPLPFDDGQFRCVFALSVLEHLLNGCAFMREYHRVLEKDGRLILLTPNISTFFTIALLLAGKMPSSGPHPDSNALFTGEEMFQFSSNKISPDIDSETPMHRHLVVFSFRVLKKYLSMLGFRDVQGHGFGLYPFPTIMQPLLEKMDPYHCHQMVFVAMK